MFRILPDLPSHVVGFEADGTVTRPDVEALFRDVDRALGRGPVHLVGVIGGIGGMTLDAVRENVMRSLRLLPRVARIGRFAVVTDETWIGAAARAQGALLPVEVRVWPSAEQDAAVLWASALPRA